MSEERTQSDEFQEFMRKIGKCAMALVLLVVAGIPFFYLFIPWLSGLNPVEPGAMADRSGAIDLFIAPDASMSADRQVNERIANAIINMLAEGDRLSVLKFGSDTNPRRVEPPTRDIALARVNLTRQTPRELHGKTDFALLFKRLKTAIARDRERNPSSGENDHRDLVVILSDGVPDGEGRHWKCPDEASLEGKPFINQNIVSLFDSLVHSKYETQEEIQVVLVLIGGSLRCREDIKTEWEVNLGPKLKVLSYLPAETGETETQLVTGLFSLQDRHPSIFFIPADQQLTEDDRRQFDKGEPFSAKYNAFSQLTGGEITISTASLRSGKENQKIALLRVTSSKPDKGHLKAGPVHLFLPPPEKGHLRGTPIPITVYFEFHDQDFKNLAISEHESYRLQLHANSGLGEPRTEDLAIAPSIYSNRKTDLRSRARRTAYSFAVLALALLGIYLLYYKGKLSSIRWLEHAVLRLLVTPFKALVCICCAHIASLIVAWGILATSQLVPVLVIAPVLPWVMLKQLEKYPSRQGLFLARAVALTTEYLLLPLIPELTSFYLTS